MGSNQEGNGLSIRHRISRFKKMCGGSFPLLSPPRGSGDRRMLFSDQVTIRLSLPVGPEKVAKGGGPSE